MNREEYGYVHCEFLKDYLDTGFVFWITTSTKTIKTVPNG